VYIKEAHPTDGRASPANKRAGIEILDPKTYAERLEVAKTACEKLEISLPCLIDGMDDAVNRAYAAQPDRIYVVDSAGKIAVHGARGPGGFAPALREARGWLEKTFAAAKPQTK
jgi:Iodothyronine deiodinase